MLNFYPDTNGRNKFIRELLKKFPFIKREEIGRSMKGRSICAYSLGNKCNRIIMVGGVHGSEYLTINLLLRFLWDLCLSYKSGDTVAGIKMKRFLNRRGVTIVPVLNPDGTEISINGKSCKNCHNPIYWQANACGVDINHNFPANWDIIHEREIKAGITAPACTRYGGKSPANQRETIAIMNYCIKNNFERCYAFHSQGREIYYEFGENTPKESLAMARLLSKTSGYTISAPSEIADGAGLKDWFIERFRKPGFTFEIGKGKNPLPLEDFPDEYSRLLKTLCMCVII